MGTGNATLLFAVPNTYWVNATILKEANLSGDREAVTPAKPGTRRSGSSLMQRAASFQLPGESYLSLILNRLEATR